MAKSRMPTDLTPVTITLPKAALFVLLQHYQGIISYANNNRGYYDHDRLNLASDVVYAIKQAFDEAAAR